jgi:GTP 3',8-cyclase
MEGAGRPVVDYLRISITDRCNLRCIYCMPVEGVSALSHSEVMTYEELELFTRAAVSSGIDRVRLTGGEPLVRKGAVQFVGMLASVDSRLKISLTTNGQLLARYARDLKEAGLRRINVSIDSLDPERYRSVTRVGNLEDTLEGLRAAIDAGLGPVKVNVVALKGINDDPAPFADLVRELPVHVRFIEYMPYFHDPGRWLISGDEMKTRLEGVVRLAEGEAPEGWGPGSTASSFTFPGAAGTIGFISPVTCHFCSSCNRLRISADGRLRTCLFDRNGIDVKREIRAGADAVRLREIIDEELARKAREGGHMPGPGARMRAGDHMSRIGG